MTGAIQRKKLNIEKVENIRELEKLSNDVRFKF